MENSLDLFLNEGSNNIDPLRPLFPVALIATAKRVEPLLSRKIPNDVRQSNIKRSALHQSSSVLRCSFELTVLVHLITIYIDLD